MMLPEGTKLRKGDHVALTAVVRWDCVPSSSDPYVSLDILGPGSHQLTVNVASIKGVVRRFYAKGDRVVLTSHHLFRGEKGEVVAVSDDGELLWVAVSERGYHTISAHDVDLIEPTDSDSAEIEVFAVDVQRDRFALASSDPGIPEGSYIRQSDGALIVPDEALKAGLPSPSPIWSTFERVETASGRILKMRKSEAAS